MEDKQYLVSEYWLASRISNCFISSAQNPHALAKEILADEKPVQIPSEDKIKNILLDFHYRKNGMTLEKSISALSNLISDDKDTICHNPPTGERYYDGHGNDVTDKMFSNDKGEVIELCEECAAKHITKLSENGGIPI